jgi:hypothetical protein
MELLPLMFYYYAGAHLVFLDQLDLLVPEVLLDLRENEEMLVHPEKKALLVHQDLQALPDHLAQEVKEEKKDHKVKTVPLVSVVDLVTRVLLEQLV